MLAVSTSPHNYDGGYKVSAETGLSGMASLKSGDVYMWKKGIEQLPKGSFHPDGKRVIQGNNSVFSHQLWRYAATLTFLSKDTKKGFKTCI